MKPVAKLIVAVIVLAALCPVVAIAQDDVVDQARALMEKKEFEKAMDLLGEAATEERLAEPRFMLAIADAARLYAPEIPVLNGGDASRVKYFKEAGLMYQKVRKSEDADKTQKLQAKTKLTQLRLAMLEEADRVRKTKGSEQMMRVGLAIADLWHFETDGGMLVYEAGVMAENEEVQLMGMRLVVQCKSRVPNIYTLASMLEQSVDENGRGNELALAHLDTGLKAIPNNLVLLDMKARLLIDMQRNDAALATIAAFDKQVNAIEDEKKRAPYVGHAGMLHDLHGNSATAIMRYEWSLARQPEQVVIREALGSGYFNRAVRQMQAMSEQEEGSPAWKESKRTFEADLQLSREQLEYVHENAEPNLSVMNTLMHIYQQQGEDEAFMRMRRDLKKVQNGEPIR